MKRASLLTVAQVYVLAILVYLRPRSPEKSMNSWGGAWQQRFIRKLQRRGDAAAADASCCATVLQRQTPRKYCDRPECR
jgi:hypothetical protein